MKKALWIILGIALALAVPVYAQSDPTFWKFVGTLQPKVASWMVEAPGGLSGTSLTISGLKSCTGIQTNANGTTSCSSAAAFTFGQGLTTNGTLITLTPSHSGTTIWATTALRSSGSLVWEGAASGATLTVSGQFDGVGLSDCDADNQTIAWDASTKRFSCGDDDDTNTTYTAGKGLALTSTSFSTNDTLTGTMLRFLTVSGSLVYGQTTIASSGGIVLEGTLSGSAIRGFGLNTDCDTAGTSKLLWDTTAGRFSCGTDTDTNTTYTAGQSLTLTSTAFSLSSTISGTLLEFQTVSGSTTYGSKSLRSSGALTWEGAGSGASLYVGDDFEGAGLSDCDADGQALSWDSTTKRFVCGDDDGTAYTAGQGLTLSSTVFRLTAFHSGTTIWATTALRSSGTLVFEGNGSGQSLALGGGSVLFSTTGSAVFNENSRPLDYRFEGDGDANLLFLDASTDRVGIGIVVPKVKLEVVGTISGALITQNGAGTNYFLGNVGLGQTTADTRLDVLGTISGSLIAQNGAGTNFFRGNVSIGAATTDARLEVVGLASGSTLYAKDSVRSSGALVWEGSGSGQALAIGGGNVLFSTTGAFIWNENGYSMDMRWEGDTDANLLRLDGSADRIGIGTATPDTKLDVVGTISGSLVKGTTVSGSVIRSDYAVSPVKFQLPLSATGTAMTTGSGKTKIIIDRTMSGYKLGDVFFGVDKAGVTNTTCIHLRNRNKGNRKLLSTPACIDSTESGTTTAATPYAIAAANADVGAYDYLYVDVSTVSTTAPRGAVVILYFFKP